MHHSSPKGSFRGRYVEQYPIFLLLFMPILGVAPISLACLVLQLLGMGLYITSVLVEGKQPQQQKLLRWSGVGLWFAGLVSALWIFITGLFFAG
mgnify:FL=1|tara:strand:- start:1629 stop:1910 length:282 start_codon:yes stop_codon:yes gene_type:complete